MKSATIYLIIEPKHNYGGGLLGIEIDRVVKTRPVKLSPRYVAVQLTVEVEDSLFEQFLPEAVIRLRDTRDLITPKIEVEQQGDGTEEAAETPEEPRSAARRRRAKIDAEPVAGWPPDSSNG